ncbi:MAG: hypothetical protein AAFW89_00905 [Bacteroidota bacterium]
MIHTKLAIVFGVLILSLQGCTEFSDQSSATSYEYAISVSATGLSNAPALQSFAHASDGPNWLLFAGRTNRTNDDGGLHDLKGNYTSTSFVPPSFNERIFVYNVDKDTSWSLSFIELQTHIGLVNSPGSEIITKAALIEKMLEFGTVFRNSNPLVTQEGDFLYLVGGYGTPLLERNSSNAYQTFSHVARIHVPSMIALVKKEYEKVDLAELFFVGKNEKLKSTGGELFMIGDSLYLAGGHDFGNTAPDFQRYVDAVYPFKATPANDFTLDITLGTPLTDVPKDSLGTAYADNHSTFRRRDGPVVPSLFKNASGSLSKGLTFYSGVFKPDSVAITPDSTNPAKMDTTTWNRAWNTAIYVHPGIGPDSSYTFDPVYYQGNENVYACANFGLYDSTSNSVHTFLLGGIGNGQSAGPLQLSGFTNGGMHIQFDIDRMSSAQTLTDNIFGTSYFYGAESAFLVNSDSGIEFFNTGSEYSDLIDADATFGSTQSIDVGYIYGGIEAFQANPGTFGGGNSAASNKIWKVTLTRTPEQ